jgi:hypothetical protein
MAIVAALAQSCEHGSVVVSPASPSSSPPAAQPALLVAFAEPAAIPFPQVNPACRGERIDLGELAGKPHECRVDAYARPLPAGVTLGLEPSLVRVEHGAASFADVEVTNTTGSDAVLFIDNRCDAVTSANTVIWDDEGVSRLEDERAAERRCAPQRQQCDLDTIAVALPAGGVAVLPVRVEGTVSWTYGCVRMPGEPMPLGRFKVTAFTSVGEVSGSIEVTM